MLRGLFLIWLLGCISAAAAEETVAQAAAEAATACRAPGAVPHPADPHRLVVCAGPGRLVAVVRCPDGLRASDSPAACVPAPDDAPDAALDVAPGAPASHYRAARQAAAAAPAASSGCEAGAGLRCAGCDALLVCALEGGRLRAVANVSCSAAGDGLSCDPTRNACVPDAPCAYAAAAAVAFRCLQPGAFPDPENCLRYHLCEGTNLSHFSDTCGIAYDPEKSTCATDGDICDSKALTPPPCSTNAAAVAFPKNPSFYRVCLPQSPKGYRSAVLQCPDKQVFDPKAGSCSYVCDTKKTRFPDPSDCHVFFDCPGDSATPTIPKRGSCANGLAFDEKKQMCVQESNVKSCTPAAVNNAPATTAVSSGSGTSATLAVPPAGVQGQCTQEGVFPDPNECRRYITCSRNRRTGLLTRTVRYCPLFMSYNAGASACWFDFCV